MTTQKPLSAKLIREINEQNIINIIPGLLYVMINHDLIRDQQNILCWEKTDFKSTEGFDLIFDVPFMVLEKTPISLINGNRGIWIKIVQNDKVGWFMHMFDWDNFVFNIKLWKGN